MIAIVESGATKSAWRVGDRSFTCAGTNVSSMPMETVKEHLCEGLLQIDCRLDGFYFYTAGIVTEEIRLELEAFLHSKLDVAEVEIQNDLVAAARAVCGHSKGIAAILGTGSNACFYDGTDVELKAYSGGFIIGDDGGAAALGRRFMADFIKDLVPADVAEDFATRFDSSYQSIVENIYRGGAPAAYLGSFAPFLLEWYPKSAYVHELVDSNFHDFIVRLLSKYPVDEYKVGVVGGFGYACRDIFSKVADSHGISLGRFVPAPIDGLADYHF